MSTIRDQESGQIVYMTDDGRRLTFDVDHAHDRACSCGDAVVSVTFDRAELLALALLGGGK